MTSIDCRMVSATRAKLPYAQSQTVADMSHAFPASSRGGCGQMRSGVGGCGKLSATDQWLDC
jgi:hypothetical protein